MPVPCRVLVCTRSRTLKVTWLIHSSSSSSTLPFPSSLFFICKSFIASSWFKIVPDIIFSYRRFSLPPPPPLPHIASASSHFVPSFAFWLRWFVVVGWWWWWYCCCTVLPLPLPLVQSHSENLFKLFLCALRIYWAETDWGIVGGWHRGVRGGGGVSTWGPSELRGGGDGNRYTHVWLSSSSHTTVSSLFFFSFAAIPFFSDLITCSR